MGFKRASEVIIKCHYFLNKVDLHGKAMIAHVDLQQSRAAKSYKEQHCSLDFLANTQNLWNSELWNSSSKGQGTCYQLHVILLTATMKMMTHQVLI